MPAFGGACIRLKPVHNGFELCCEGIPVYGRGEYYGFALLEFGVNLVHIVGRKYAAPAVCPAVAAADTGVNINIRGLEPYYGMTCILRTVSKSICHGAAVSVLAGTSAK